MSLAWSFFFPVAIIAARYYKVMPRQNFPQEIDNQWWWIMHRVCVGLGTVAVLIGFSLIYYFSSGDVTANELHRYLGWSALVLLMVQIAGGLLRGTRGGPKMRHHQGALRGDHYDMTSRRIVFERVHKSVGYLAIAVAWTATVAGLWHVNAPIWIWLLTTGWWACMCIFAVYLQKQHRAIDTYQAIWGTNPELVGNKLPIIGIGIHRIKHQDKR